MRQCAVRSANGLILVALLAGLNPSWVDAAVKRHEYLAVGGARLYMEVIGKQDESPLLIWLHGGPGGAERPLFRLYNAALEECFVVVYLDQRGTGKSFDRAADPATLTIARHLLDLDAVVEHLLSEFERDEVILVGHSWGSALGMLYAQAQPEQVAAVVGVGQVTSTRAAQQSQFEFVASEAQRRNDAKATARIEQIGPPPFTAQGEIAIQRLVEKYGGYWRDSPNLLFLTLKAAVKGYMRPWELPRMIGGNNVSLQAMNDELLALDLPGRVPSVDTPVIFMLGRYDRQVDSRLAAEYFDRLSAPEKQLMWFDTAHNVPFEAPEEFDTALPRLLVAVGAIPKRNPRSLPPSRTGDLNAGSGRRSRCSDWRGQRYR